MKFLLTRIVSGALVLLRSFMIDSGDSDLLHQKLSMSQYLALKSEPLGQLGDCTIPQQRVNSQIIPSLIFFNNSYKNKISLKISALLQFQCGRKDSSR